MKKIVWSVLSAGLLSGAVSSTALAKEGNSHHRKLPHLDASAKARRADDNHCEPLATQAKPTHKEKRKARRDRRRHHRD